MSSDETVRIKSEDLAKDLLTIVMAREEMLRSIADITASEPLGPGKWSTKEVLGHLIDSAVNNLQRFIRAQQTSDLHLPGYDQQFWVEAGGYRETSWHDLIELWSALNKRVAHVMKRIPEESLEHTLTIGGGESVTLEFVVADYLRHLKQHLDQIRTVQS